MRSCNDEITSFAFPTARARSWYPLIWTKCFLVVISYDLISSVTISLGKIICWPLRDGPLENLLGEGAGEVQKKYSRKGKLNEKNLCTPINPKKYSCYGPKKIRTRNLVIFPVHAVFFNLSREYSGTSIYEVPRDCGIEGSFYRQTPPFNEFSGKLQKCSLYRGIV